MHFCPFVHPTNAGKLSSRSVELPTFGIVGNHNSENAQPPGIERLLMRWTGPQPIFAVSCVAVQSRRCRVVFNTVVVSKAGRSSVVRPR